MKIFSVNSSLVTAVAGGPSFAWPDCISVSALEMDALARLG